jgi:adenylosuccinate lyase
MTQVIGNLAMPGNPRYQPKELVPYFGYDNFMNGLAEIEIANLQVLAEIGVMPHEDISLLTPDILARLRVITTSEVDVVERETKHDVRAWVRIAQEITGPKLGRWMHALLTSYDAIDSGRIVQYTRAHQQVLLPTIKEVLLLFAELTRRFAGELQIGRTHGQHALPITVGFWFATILSRVLYCAQQMDFYSNALVGKISGAVGAYNAQVGLGITERCGQITFEERLLKRVGIKPGPVSTQILQPEPLAFYLYSCNMLSAALAQFGRDGRSLMRTEIAEIAEAFESQQVGSSTMAHKRNPLTFENTEGQWIRTKNEFGKVQDTLISEHQRDLVASCVMRDFPAIPVNVQYQLNTLRRQTDDGTPFLRRLTVDPHACQTNFKRSAGVILAEPLYLALQMAGYEGDAHELVNRTLIPGAKEHGKTLMEELVIVAEDNEDLQAALDRIPPTVLGLFSHPESYIGSATEKALQIADQAEAFVASV